MATSAPYNPTESGADLPVGAGIEDAVTLSLPAAAPASAVSSTLPVRIDFALLSGGLLLVYGWIRDPDGPVKGALLQVGESVINLTTHSRRVRRPDVAEHFRLAAGDDEHGFYLLVELAEPSVELDHLHLTVVTTDGESHRSRWPIEQHDPLANTIPSAYTSTLENVLRGLSGQEGKRLTRFLSRGVRKGLVMHGAATLPPPIQFEIDFCCVLEDRVLVVYGWLFDPAEEMLSPRLRVGDACFDLFASAMAIPRLDINPDPQLYGRRDMARLPGFLLVQPMELDSIASEHVGGGDAIFTIATRTGDPLYMARPVCWNPPDSRHELFLLLGRIDVESALLLTERLISVMQELPGTRSLLALLELNRNRAAERLPGAIQQTRCSLHLDRAIPVAEGGVYLNGWFHAEPGTQAHVVCYCGNASYSLSEHWTRHTRTDVSTYLATKGSLSDDHEHGFSCYVALKRCGTPYWITVTLESGESHSMKVQVDGVRSASQTVRELLRTFHSEQRELVHLLDRQIGPAMQAAWSSRRRPVRREFIESYGLRPASPEVSVLVPLYGRWDFAEYQMALFADDEEFQRTELIYVVDDPAIFDRFQTSCAGLYEIYRVPFTVVYPGANLGFAGANNFGAEAARGQSLLLMNSDVLPKRTGWLGELLRARASLREPGMVGAKLLYEDGTLQHAGITFRRHLPWGGLWINDHPGKGQNAASLSGTREVEAVTAACALMDAELYRALGGLSEDYIIGDFEDTDLCLRAQQMGRRSYVALDVELYHLERQSQNQVGDAAWRTNLTAYNCWLHNNRWAESIEQLVAMRPELRRAGDRA